MTWPKKQLLSLKWQTEEIREELLQEIQNKTIEKHNSIISDE